MVWENWNDNASKYMSEICRMSRNEFWSTRPLWWWAGGYDAILPRHVWELHDSNVKSGDCASLPGARVGFWLIVLREHPRGSRLRVGAVQPRQPCAADEPACHPRTQTVRVLVEVAQLAASQLQPVCGRKHHEAVSWTPTSWAAQSRWSVTTCLLS